MSRQHAIKPNCCLLLCLLISASTTLAQRRSQLPPPLNLSGALTAGYYDAKSKNGISASQRTALSSIRLNLSGYLHHPKFLTFDVKPQFSVGRQSTETFFPDGRGISATATFLGGNSFPLTVSYTRLGRQVVTFGTLDRLAGLAADSSQSSLTANWRIRLKRLPQVSVTYSRYADKYEPLAAVTSQFENRSRMVVIDLQDRRLGWQFDSQFRKENTRTDLLDLFSISRTSYQVGRDMREVRVSASRDFGRSFHLNLLGGHTKSDNEVAQRMFNQDYFYFFGNAGWRMGKKLTGNVHSGFTRNLVGFQLVQALPGSIPPSSPLLSLSQTRLNLLTISSRVQYALSRDFRLDGQFSHDSTFAPMQTSLVTPRSHMNGVQGGFSYSRDFRRWQLRTSYALSAGRLRFDNLVPGRTLGHHSNTGVTLWAGLGFEVSASGQIQWQSTENSFRLTNRLWAGDFAIARNFVAGWKTRFSYGFDRSAFDTQSSRFESDGQGFGFLFGHRVGEFVFSRHQRTGLSLDPALRRGILPAAQVRPILTAFPNLRGVPSGAEWTSISATLRPFRKLTVRSWWMRNEQDLSGRTSNNYEQWESSVGYQFRLLVIDFGYARYRQDLGFTEFSRNRFFFRMIREFRVL